MPARLLHPHRRVTLPPRRASDFEQALHQSPAFLDHLGFTLIALLVGFVAIAVLDLGSPTWLVVTAAISCIVAGHLSLQRLKARESQRPTAHQERPRPAETNTPEH